MMQTTRARRRHDLARMKAKARRYNKERAVSFGFAATPKQAEKRANHLAGCSCMMCGNPRRYWGDVTMQERRAPQPGEWG